MVAIFRKFHSFIILLIVPGLLAACAAAPSGPVTQNDDATAVIYLVRHAEKMTDVPDPSLSAAGRERALKLVERLVPEDLSYIHSTNYKRTLETVEPLSLATGIEIELYDPRNLLQLADEMRAIGGRHLVVGHSNTTPALVEILGGDPGSAIDEKAEYDRLYIIRIAEDGTVTSVLERFGKHYAP
jgi:broad specificity phosphatase PhoE